MKILFFSIRPNKLIFLILLIGLLIRLFAAFSAYQNNVMAGFSDDLLYNDMAKSIIKDGIMDFQENKGLAYTIICPGLPVLLSLEKRMLGDSWLGIFIINALLSSLIIWFVYKIARGATNTTVALISSFWAAIYIPYIQYVPSAGKEIWIGLLFIMVCWVYISYIHDNEFKTRQLLYFGFLLSILILVDERYITYLLLFSICLVFYRNKSIPLSRSLLNNLYLILIVTCLVSPWVIRNYMVYHEILPISSRTAHLSSRILGTKTQFPDVIDDIVSNRFIISDEKIDSIRNGFDIRDNAGRELNPQHYDAIRNYDLIPYKFTYRENVLMSFRTFWKPIDISYNYTTGGYRFDGKWSLKHNLVIGLLYGILLPLSLIGLFVLSKHNRKLTLFFSGILIFHTLIHILFIPFTRFRYRIPIDFILIIMGCYGALFLIELIFKKNKNSIS